MIQGPVIGFKNDAIQRNADSAFIPFDPANTDYQTFKKDLADGVQLLDADGNTMTEEQVATFLATLP